MINYSSLHSHSSYSYLDGLGLPKQIAERVKELGQKYCAITDHGVITGHAEFWTEMVKASLVPLLGSEMYHVGQLRQATKRGSRTKEEAEAHEIAHITILARDQIGYRNLLKLSSLSYEKGFYKKPSIDTASLIEHQEGLIVLSGCVIGHVSRLINANKLDQACEWIAYFKRNIEHFYVEICPCHTLEISKIACTHLWRMADELGIPRVITDDAHFPRPADYLAQDTLLCANTRTRWKPLREFQLPPYHFHCSSEEILDRARKTLPEIPEADLIAAIERSVMIAEGCTAELPKSAGPVFKIDRIPPEKSPLDLLKQWAQEGKTYRRQLGLLPDENSPEWQAYLQREDYEFGIVAHHKFENYFLIVSDVVRWANANDCWCIARGSCGGSLICWYLGITQIDPIRFDLPVERFVDFTRADLPDIDLDFDAEARDRVFAYLEDQYGTEHCAHIAALSSFGARQALNDVAFVHQVPDNALAAITALVPEAEEADEGLHDAQVLRRLYLTSETARGLFKRHKDLLLAIKLEGQFRTSSIHAAGFVIDSKPLTETVGICSRPGKVRCIAVNKDYAAAQGLLKIDVLSSYTMTGIVKCLKSIGKNVDWLYQLPLDDAGTYMMLGRGLNQGLFQLSGSAAGRILKDLKPETFDEIAAVCALARPGPMQSGSVEHFVRRAHHIEELPWLHPIFDRILGKTHGIILYQEQVMAVAREAGGLDWGKVHKIRKLVSKSGGANAVQEYEAEYLDGCRKLQISEEEAKRVWQQCLSAGNYSFNQCVTGDTIVIRGSKTHNGGGDISIHDLYQAQQSRTSWGNKIRCGYLTLMQMSADGRIRPGRLKAIYHNGKAQTVRISTASGKQIRITTNHRLLTDDGYQEASSLTVGVNLVVMGPKDNRKKKPVGFNPTAEYARGKEYGPKEGFPEGKRNPSWKDGRRKAFEEAQCSVRDRANGKCELCGSENLKRPEYAHVYPLESFGGNYICYHSAENLLWLCNPCHKKLDYEKGERPGKWAYGYLSELDPIVSIEPAGIEDVYDLEMKTEEHNYIANGIVSHNSHAYAYALVAYWTAYLKCHYPSQFTAAMAYCFHGQSADDKRRQLFRDFQVMGGKTQLLDFERSQESFVALDNSTVLGGFGDLKGWGPESIRMALESRARRPFASWQDFYGRTSRSLGDLIRLTGIHTGQLDTDVVLSLAPWYPEVHLNELEQQVQEQKRCFPICHLSMALERPDIFYVPIVGRITALRVVDLVAQAKKYGGQPPAAGQARYRAVVTITDHTGTVDVGFSAEKWEQISDRTRICLLPEEGRGSSVLVDLTVSADRTRIYGEDLRIFRHWKRHEIMAPPQGNKMTMKQREEIGGQLAMAFEQIKSQEPFAPVR